MIEMQIGKCQEMTEKGTRCTWPPKDSGYCHRHDPSPEARARRKRDAQKAGLTPKNGRRNGSNGADQTAVLSPVKLRGLDDARDLCEQTLNEHRAGLIDRHTARLQLQACRDHVHQIEMCDLEASVAQLQEVLKEHGLEGAGWGRLLDHLSEWMELRKGRR